MMYNIHTGRGGVPYRGNDEIIIMVSTLHRVKEQEYPFVFTSGHAYSLATEYFDDLAKLDQVDWPLLQARNFARSLDDPLQIERYRAEALIYQHLPVSALMGVICYTDAIKLEIEREIDARELTLSVNAMTGWYF